MFGVDSRSKQNFQLDRRDSHPNTDEVRNRLGAHVAEAMQNIAALRRIFLKNCADKMNFEQCLCYPEDYAKALLARKPPAKQRYEHLRDHNLLIHGRMPSCYFTPVKINDKIQDFEWTLASGVLPSDALLAAKQGFSEMKTGGVGLIDCGVSVNLARYTGLLTYLTEVNGSSGIEKFNRLFSEPHGQALNLGFRDTSLQPLRHFIVFTEHVKRHEKGEIGSRYVKVGQSASINGVSNYNQKFPLGMDSNHNVICIDSSPGAQLFCSLSFPPAGSTELEIYQDLATAYNQKPDHLLRIPRDKISELRLALEFAQRYENDTVSLDQPESVVVGFDPYSIEDFQPALIQSIVEMPVEMVTLDAVKKSPFASVPGEDYVECDVERGIATLTQHFPFMLKRGL